MEQFIFLKDYSFPRSSVNKNEGNGPKSGGLSMPPAIFKKGDIVDGILDGKVGGGDLFVTLKTKQGDFKVLIGSSTSKFDPIVDWYKESGVSNKSVKQVEKEAADSGFKVNLFQSAATIVGTGLAFGLLAKFVFKMPLSVVAVSSCVGAGAGFFIDTKIQK